MVPAKRFAFVATLGLLAFSGKYLLPQLVVALAAMIWTVRQRSRVAVAP